MNTTYNAFYVRQASHHTHTHTHKRFVFNVTLLQLKCKVYGHHACVVQSASTSPGACGTKGGVSVLSAENNQFPFCPNVGSHLFRSHCPHTTLLHIQQILVTVALCLQFHFRICYPTLPCALPLPWIFLPPVTRSPASSLRTLPSPESSPPHALASTLDHPYPPCPACPPPCACPFPGPSLPSPGSSRVCTVITV